MIVIFIINEDRTKYLIFLKEKSYIYDVHVQIMWINLNLKRQQAYLKQITARQYLKNKDMCIVNVYITSFTTVLYVFLY